MTTTLAGNPFHIVGPAVVSFSGGRTSGLMLRRILDAHGGRLPLDVRVIFSNTGKEREETLEFVRDVEREWKVPITWLERWAPNAEHPSLGGLRIVCFETAARNGEPFSSWIVNRNYLPNPTARFCTVEMKINATRDFMRSTGAADDEWVNAVGLRADEPARVARVTANGKGWETVCPLATAGVTKADVDAFWRSQPFDLRLKGWEGNCDLCFMKGVAKRARIIRDRPDLARWWQEEERIAIARPSSQTLNNPSMALFRKDVMSYARIAETVRQSPLLIVDAEPACEVDDIADCICGEAA